MDAREWNERYGASDMLWGVEPNQFVRAQCQSLPVGTAIDLGCGEGRNALWLARIGWSVTGVDISDVAIDRAIQLTEQEPTPVQERLKWKVGDIRSESLKKRSFNLALISYIHFDADEMALLQHEAARAVRPGGHLLIVGHDKRNLIDGIGGPQEESLLYDPAEIADRVSALGFTVELASTVERAKDGAIAYDTLVRARARRRN